MSSVTRNFDAVRGDTHSTQLPSTTRRRTLPKLVKHHLKERSPHRVAYMIPEDYDSEVSEIHDIQSRMSAKLSTKSANNAEYMTAPGPPSEAKYPQRPSINLLASSNLSQGYLSDENDREHSASSGSILKQTGNLHITRPRPKFNGFHILQEKDEEDVSDDGSVPESAKNNVSSMSSFVFRPAATLSPSLFGTPSADKIHEMDNYFSFPSHDMMSPVDQRCHSSLSAYHSGPKKQETKSARPCSTHLYNTSGSAAELYSPSSSIVSSAVASQLIIAPCTPLQLYCYMPDSGSVGFECPFSTLTATNQNLLDLLVYSQRDTATDTSSNNSSTSFNVTVPKSPLDRTQGPMVTSGNVPREVLFRSLSALVNATFVPIQTAVNGNTGTFLTNRTSDTSKLNRMTGKCDMLSQFTWKLLQVFYWDLKSTINVYEVFLSSFSPNSGRNSTRDLIPSSRTSNRNDTYTSCDALEGLSSGPLPLIFSDPTLLNYEALRNLEEYLSGTLALFVKVINHAIILFFDYLCLLALIFLSYSYQISAFLLSIQASASLLTAVDNVAVMKERRRRGIF